MTSDALDDMPRGEALACLAISEINRVAVDDLNLRELLRPNLW
jgi:hypothetical protein